MVKNSKNLLIKFIFLVSIIALVSAFFIEYFLGHQPCNLCVLERIPYFLGIIIVLLNYKFSQFERFFMLLPLIHSEEIQDHIFVKQLGEVFLKDHINYENIMKSWDDHTSVIKRFRRYPHRNKILNRESTIDEISFLKEPNSSW